MQFDLKEATEVLERTPLVLEAMLVGISEEWIKNNEGPETWSPYDILGHLIHGEKTDWIPRMERILSEKSDAPFEAFDRFAQFRDSKGKNFRQLLDEFKTCRAQNLVLLRARELNPSDLQRKGIHPVFGEVTLVQLLSTWVVHDLNHLAQIARVMAKQYKKEVGPWVEYLSVLKG